MNEPPQRPAPEFEQWLTRMGAADAVTQDRIPAALSPAMIGLA